MSTKEYFFRKCDSRNLNLSPFCNLASPSMALAKWQPAVNSTYGNTTTTYTSEVEGPMRLKYPGQGKAAPEGELLTSLTEVVLYPNPSISLIMFSALITDLKKGGEPVLQCVRKGHCCCKHLLWKLNCLWFGKFNIF